jgi:Tol biopolymer transport system component/DNA-binding winged helix-turn-helix (wHTH) protein
MPWSFGDFRLDEERRQLLRGDTPLPVEPKAFELLSLLVERQPRALSKAQIHGVLWAGTFVSESALAGLVADLRAALGDDARRPRFIWTVHGFGYAFCGEARDDGQPRAAPAEAVLRVPVLGTAGSLRNSVAPELLPAALRVPVTETASSAPAAAIQAPTAPRWPRRAIGVGAAGVAVSALAAVWLLRAPHTISAPPMHVVPLTTLSGFEAGGFSPDGRQLAFDWEGEGPPNRDIYMKLVGSSELRRLTTDPAVDVAAVWSPDGSQIAYVRLEPRPFVSWRVRVMSSLGGADRQVSDFPAWVPANWSPDGRYLVAGRASPPDAADPSNGLYLIPVRGGEPRAITRPKAPEVHTSGRFSPDGRQLAYVSCEGAVIRTDCHIDVLDVDATFAASGAPRRLTRPQRDWVVSQRPPAFPTGIMGLTWSRDGKSIVYSADEFGLIYLWRVGVDGEHPPVRIEVAGVNAIFPGIAATGDRLVFSRRIDDEDIYRFDAGRPAQPVARSSVFASNPQFSPDGRRIAFCSLRSGDAMEVWVADADGSTPRQLTHGPGRRQCGAAWSPDGRRIAFDSQAADGSRHVWTVDIDGGTPQQITKAPGDQVMPTWSRDGEWIYYSWKQRNERDLWRRDIWRIQRRTGSVERITHDGGVAGRESADGKTVLYQPKVPTSPLLAQSLAGGAPRRLAACVVGTAVSVSQAGVYYVPCPDPAGDPDPQVRVMNPAWARIAKSGGWRSTSTTTFRQASRSHRTVASFSTVGRSAPEPTS